jgi:hypothetical protein
VIAKVDDGMMMRLKAELLVKLEMIIESSQNGRGVRVHQTGK